ncbi:putative reverse transcriptase zinc-binding domain-containing protein [Helianthus annuus]|nr:putative reverse transcriptase zinc-binding domain-containing protein [Helianthus annuus]
MYMMHASLWLHRRPITWYESLRMHRAFLMHMVTSVNLSDRKDGWIWKGDQSGGFSVSSVKRFLEGSVVSDSSFRLEWCKWVPIKCNIFVWRAEQGRIPTSDELRKRSVAVGDGLCPFCRSEEESASHLFTSCFMATILWQKISSWCPLPPIFAFSVRDLLEYHKFCSLKAAEKDALHGIMFTACWCLWLMRNKAIFSAAAIKVENIFSEVRSMGYLWYKNRVKGSSISWLDWCRFVIM